MTGNRLGQETSPYLLQHKDNPVHWQPWDDEACARARREDKPILLSIGYSACHWCHVMAHESFEDPDTAAVMNDLFVNIKVDREERPDLDAIYQTALALLGQPGGWPLTMFLTPDGEPFWGGTYFPPTARYGRPGFRDVLQAVSRVYKDEPDKVKQNRDSLATALRQLSRRPGGGEITLAQTDEAAQRLLREVDPVYGGLDGAPKFPQVSAFELLWRAYCRRGDEAYRDAVLRTAHGIAQGGIYDHLGGGFARYTTDEKWLVPHFEKMLYDNALLVEHLALVWQETHEPVFAARIEETVGWLFREMAAPDGGFASALDADSEGVEGKYYTWTAEGIDRILGDEAAMFKAAYGVTAQGNWEGTNILNRLTASPAEQPVDEARLAELRPVLLRERERRVPPGRDDKVLADWNGLMIAALASAGATFDRPAWVDAAAATFAFVRERMSVDGRLQHSYRAGELKGTAVLDDYANMARAALCLYEATGEPDYLEQARTWVAVADRHYWDSDAGGYFYTADDAGQLVVRTKTAFDSSVPPGNATMVGVLARLFALTAEPAYRERAEAVVSAFSADAARNPLAFSTLLNANELLRSTVQVVLVGDAADERTRGLRRAVFEVGNPNRVLAEIAPDTALPEGHPAAGKAPRDGSATAYVCLGETCSLPITEPEGLRAALSPRPAAPV